MLKKYFRSFIKLRLNHWCHKEWGWVNNHQIFIFGWTVPLSTCWHLARHAALFISKSESIAWNNFYDVTSFPKHFLPIKGKRPDFVMVMSPLVHFTLLTSYKMLNSSTWVLLLFDHAFYFLGVLMPSGGKHNTLFWSGGLNLTVRLQINWVTLVLNILGTKCVIITNTA